MTNFEAIRQRVRAEQLVISICVAATVACGPAAKLPLAAGVGPNPELPPPQSSLIPTVKVANARDGRVRTSPPRQPASW